MVHAAHAFLDWPAPVALAHRGGGGEQPENTLAAFQAAWDLGYRYLETDVHATRDGVLLAFHDHVLDRVTGVTGSVAKMSYVDVRAAPAGLCARRGTGSSSVIAASSRPTACGQPTSATSWSGKFRAPIGRNSTCFEPAGPANHKYLRPAA